MKTPVIVPKTWPTPSGKVSVSSTLQVTKSPCTFPNRLVLGAGDRLFGETHDKIALRLVESRPFGGAVVSMIYAPATADG